MGDLGNKLLAWIDEIGRRAEDTQKERIHKVMMVRGQVMFLLGGLVWGLVYFSLGEVVAGWIPFGYGLITLMSLMLYARTKRYKLFRFSQLVLTLFLPFFLGLALGGFENSSAVIIWGLSSPLIALLFDEPKRFPYWFLAYLGLVALSAFLEPHLRESNNLSEAVRDLFFVMNIGVVSGIVFLLFYYFVNQVNILQDKSERLILNVLPAEIAAVLRDEGRIIADKFQDASILFADIVDFTPMSASMSPEELVDLLNEVFSYFDSLVEEFGLEKIKTIGDCYMVASGVPRPRDDHALILVELALRIRDYVSRQRIRGRRLSFRIGVNSGPVVAGVIGRKKFIYDLWGDAVNVASRMESGGIGGEIQITEATHRLIEGCFECESRGEVMVKGKGMMPTWRVIGKKGEDSLGD